MQYKKYTIILGEKSWPVNCSPMDSSIPTSRKMIDMIDGRVSLRMYCLINYTKI